MTRVTIIRNGIELAKMREKRMVDHAKKAANMPIVPVIITHGM
jgi:hypothetical protein